MTAAEFRTALKSLGINQTEAAKRMNVHRVKVARWATGISRIDGEVEALLQCWQLKGSKRRKKHF